MIMNNMQFSAGSGHSAVGIISLKKVLEKRILHLKNRRIFEPDGEISLYYVKKHKKMQKK